MLPQRPNTRKTRGNIDDKNVGDEEIEQDLCVLLQTCVYSAHSTAAVDESSRRHVDNTLSPHPASKLRKNISRVKYRLLPSVAWLYVPNPDRRRTGVLELE